MCCLDRRFRERVPRFAGLRAEELKEQQRKRKESLRALEQEKSALEIEEKKPFQGAFRHKQVKDRLAEVKREIAAIKAFEPSSAPQKEVAVA